MNNGDEDYELPELPVPDDHVSNVLAFIFFWVAIVGLAFPAWMIGGPWGWFAYAGAVILIAGFMELRQLNNVLVRFRRRLTVPHSARIALSLGGGLVLLLSAGCAAKQLTVQQNRELEAFDICAPTKDRVHDETRALIARMMTEGTLTFPEALAGFLMVPRLRESLRRGEYYMSSTRLEAEYLRKTGSPIFGTYSRDVAEKVNAGMDRRLSPIQSCLETRFGYRFSE